MGLDMHLYKKIYVGNQYRKKKSEKVKVKFPKSEESAYFKIGILEENLNDNLSELVYEVAYWRKANAIHKWFIDNCQDGVDDCRESNIEQEQIKELVNLCKEIIADNSKAEELLPTTSGFFFGETDYDDWYFKNIQNTIDQLESLINENESSAISYTYRSSW